MLVTQPNAALGNSSIIYPSGIHYVSLLCTFSCFRSHVYGRVRVFFFHYFVGTYQYHPICTIFVYSYCFWGGMESKGKKKNEANERSTAGLPVVAPSFFFLIVGLFSWHVPNWTCILREMSGRERGQKSSGENSSGEWEDGQRGRGRREKKGKEERRGLASTEKSATVFLHDDHWGHY